MQLAFAVRQKVFVEEQGVSRSIEYDGLDNQCWHVVAWYGDQVVGTGRMLPLADYLKIGRMAVLPEHRHKGVGGRMLSMLLDMAAQAGARQVVLHAQVQAVPFYQRYGFRITSDEYLEAGIRHVTMQADPATRKNGVAQG